MKRDRGFTLVELLLAVTLLSMLMALTYGGLQAATRTTDRGQKILQESGRLRMAHQFVRKQINDRRIANCVPCARYPGPDFFHSPLPRDG